MKKTPQLPPVSSVHRLLESVKKKKKSDQITVTQQG